MQNAQINAGNRMLTPSYTLLPNALRFGQADLNAANTLRSSFPDMLPTGTLPFEVLQSGLVAVFSALPSAQEVNAYARHDPVVKFTPAAALHVASAVTQQSGQTRELALLAADVYRDTPNPPAGYRVAVEGDLGKLGLKPADLTSTQSPFRARVYVKEIGGVPHYTVAFRGTNMSSASDWTSNALQSMGVSTDHYRHALYIGSKLALAQGANVTMTGHSLGGGLASAASIASGQPAATFNSAGLSGETISAARAIHSSAGVQTKDDITAYYVRGEILSAIQDGGDRIIGGIIGGIKGAVVTDAPEAYGKRIGLESVRPEGLRWYQDHAVARHGMDWVLSSLNR